MRQTLLLCFTVFWAVALVLCRPVTGQQRPNVIVILADDLGYGDVACYNAESKILTPNLDKLARQGRRFTDAHSPSTVCTPSRYGLLTGRLCFRTGSTGVLTGVDGPLIEPGRMTLAQLFREHGYRTACIGKWHLGMTFFDQAGQPVRPRGGGIEKVKQVDWTKPIEQGPRATGFDYFFGTACCPTTDWLYAYLENERVTSVPTAVVSPTTRHWLEYEHFRTGLKSEDFDFRQVDKVFLEKSIGFIERHVQETQEPFFLYHATQTAHLPALPAPEFVGRTAAGPLGDFIFQFDAIVGEFMNCLDRLGIAENTLLIVTSDNGPEIITPRVRAQFGHDSARPWRGLKRDNWEGGHRVPFIARWTGTIPAASQSDQTICHTDLLATCAAMLKHPLEADMAEDSFNFWPALVTTESEQTTIRRFTLHHTMNNSLAIRSGDWKLLAHKGSGGNDYDSEVLRSLALPERQPEAPFQLYNLASDPGETTNRYFDQSELANSLYQQLRQFRQSGRTRPVHDRADR